MNKPWNASICPSLTEPAFDRDYVFWLGAQGVVAPPTIGEDEGFAVFIDNSNTPPNFAPGCNSYATDSGLHSTMIFWRCQCGKCTLWESGMAPKPCQGCSECGTTYAVHPEGHRPVEPHQWEKRFDKKTGNPQGMQCVTCNKRDREMPHYTSANGPVDICTRVHRKLGLKDKEQEQ